MAAWINEEVEYAVNGTSAQGLPIKFGHFPCSFGTAEGGRRVHAKDVRIGAFHLIGERSERIDELRARAPIDAFERAYASS